MSALGGRRERRLAVGLPSVREGDRPPVLSSPRAVRSAVSTTIKLEPHTFPSNSERGGEALGGCRLLISISSESI